MKAAELFVKCLENEGVEYIFGIPGEENLDVMDALLDSSIKFITTRHEQGAAFMADVYGRLTGKAGVCLATLGPGATNLITGVADANLDHAPVVAIAGQASTHRLHKESHQVLDLELMFQSITKYSSRLLTPNVINEVVRKAFKLAQTEKDRRDIYRVSGKYCGNGSRRQAAACKTTGLTRTANGKGGACRQNYLGCQESHYPCRQWCDS